MPRTPPAALCALCALVALASGSTLPRTPHRTPVAIGIDLGTTNSAACVFDPSTRDATMVRNSRGDVLTPSVVCFLPDGRALVGADALDAAAGHPLSTFRSIKRLLGRDLLEDDEVAMASALLPAPSTLRRAEDGAPTLHCPTLGREVRMEEISAAVLSSLVADVLAHLDARAGAGRGGDAEGALGPELSAADSTAEGLAQSDGLGGRDGRRPSARASGAGGDGQPAGEDEDSDLDDDDDAAADADTHLRAADHLRAVITVPAEFSDAQREATELAARLAGLRHVRLMREPVAAALAYGVADTRDDAPPASAPQGRAPPERAPSQTVLVLDVGAGTTDVSVLDVTDGLVEVLASAADGRLGGDDVDDALEAWLGETLRAQHPRAAQRVAADAAARFEARRALERAKVALSVRREAEVRLPVSAEGEPCPPAAPPLALTLRRADLDAAAERVLARLKVPVYGAALNAGVALRGERFGGGRDGGAEPRGKGRRGAKRRGGGGGGAKPAAAGPQPGELVVASDGSTERSRALPQGGRAVDQLVLVGGATHMVGVRRLAANLVGVEARRTVDPLEAVARGAALQSAVSEGLLDGVGVTDAWQAQLRAAFAQLERELAQRAARDAAGADGADGGGDADDDDDDWAALDAFLEEGDDIVEYIEIVGDEDS